MGELPLIRRPLPAFAAASLFAVGVGASICALSGVPTGLWGRNVAAWLVGAVMAVALQRWAGARVLAAVLILAPVGVAAALLGPGQDGVHRWLAVGPLQVNAAMLVLPAFVVALAVAAQRTAWWPLPALLALAALVAQPDASQATALALSVCVIALSASRQRFRWPGALLAAVLAGLAWMRPDPLKPVPEVEEVVRLAFGLSPALAGLSILALAAVIAAPAAAMRQGPDAARWAGRALAALLLGWCLGPALGAFPTPLVGVGLSPVLGAWLGVGLLAAVGRLCV